MMKLLANHEVKYITENQSNVSTCRKLLFMTYVGGSLRVCVKGKFSEKSAREFIEDKDYLFPPKLKNYHRKTHTILWSHDL